MSKKPQKLLKLGVQIILGLTFWDVNLFGRIIIFGFKICKRSKILGVTNWGLKFCRVEMFKVCQWFWGLTDRDNMLAKPQTRGSVAW